MILAPLAGFALLVMIATGPVSDLDAAPRLSTPQKNAALQPLVHRTTECIARAVATDPRYGEATQGNVLADLIVDSVPACIGPVRALIDAHDRYFGEGSGEAFFMGPYLDVLPNAVAKWAKSLAVRQEASPEPAASKVNEPQ